MSPTNGSQDCSHRQQIAIDLTKMFAGLFGKDASELDPSASMIELGGDSLFLLQASNVIREKYKVKVPFRLLLEELSTINSLAVYLDQKLPHDVLENVVHAEGRSAKPSLQTPAVDTMASSLPPQEQPTQQTSQSDFVGQMLTLAQKSRPLTDDNPIHQIFAQQLALMSQQIAILTGHSAVMARPSQLQAPSNLERAQAVTEAQPTEIESLAPAARTPGDGSSSEIEPEVYVPYEAIQLEAVKSLSECQRAHLFALIERINARTGRSKSITQDYRKYHADNRTAAGFRMPWKEMFYPLVVERGQGSHIWDVDGNEYIDMTMGFGALLFGHSPDFIIEALQQQLAAGLRLGPHSREAGEAAKLICEMTGVERVAFCNSGTEAIMTALRLARTVTGRFRIALFEGCYHGTFDGILVKGQRRPDGTVRAVPLAPGIPQHMVDNVLMLKYDDPQSLDELRKHARELAAVLIEPPRSRRPDVQPREFLLELRRLTEGSGTALIFDEVVTGFRFHPGGAQAVFGIQADLVTYGKALAGGLPVAAVAGKSRFMDAVDGGVWRYGDGSYPEADITFFTGTYFKHPLLMPAVVAALRHVKESGIQLQQSINAKAKYVADELSAFFKEKGFPLKVAQLGSLFRILHGPELRYMDLFYYHLLDKGIYVCETHNCLVSTAHTDPDMEAVIDAAKESLLELRDGGFLPGAAQRVAARTDTGKGQQESIPTNAIRAPLTEAQRQIWAVSHMADGDSQAYNLPLVVQWRGNLDAVLLSKTVNSVIQRHQAFRATFSPDGDFQMFSPLSIEIPVVDLSGLLPEAKQAQVERWRKLEARQLFDFVAGPLLSLRLLRLEPDLHLLLLTMHHIVSDGWSLGVFLNELLELYSAESAGTSPQLPDPRSFADYAMAKSAKEEQSSDSEAFWTSEFPNSMPRMRLPADNDPEGNSGIQGAQARMVMPTAGAGALKEVSRRYSCTRFMVMLALCKIFIYYLTRQEEIVIGVPAAGQNLPDGGYLAGCCVNLLALRTQMNLELSFPELVVLLRQKLVKVYEHADYPFNRLLKRLRSMHPDRPEPAISVIFNLDKTQTSKKQPGFGIEVLPNHNETSKFDLTIDLTETPDSLIIDFEYKTALFTRERISCWMELFKKLIQDVSGSPARKLREYYAVLQEEEARQKSVLTQELKQQERQRFATSKRKSIAT